MTKIHLQVIVDGEEGPINNLRPDYAQLLINCHEGYLSDVLCVIDKVVYTSGTVEGVDIQLYATSIKNTDGINVIIS